jgi:hypothetical protein
MGKPNSISWYEYRVGKYRQGTSYQKDASHAKMSTARREEIRTQKYWKHSRRKKNYRHRRWYYGGRSRQYCLKVSQRRLRRWFKHKLHTENFDLIPTMYPSVMFYDPWSWS